jgi:hypothetical protein
MESNHERDMQASNVDLIEVCYSIIHVMYVCAWAYICCIQREGFSVLHVDIDSRCTDLLLNTARFLCDKLKRQEVKIAKIEKGLQVPVLMPI